MHNGSVSEHWITKAVLDTNYWLVYNRSVWTTCPLPSPPERGPSPSSPPPSPSPGPTPAEHPCSAAAAGSWQPEGAGGAGGSTHGQINMPGLK